MTIKQKLIKYFALAFAVFLIVNIALLAFGAVSSLLGLNIHIPDMSDVFGFSQLSETVSVIDIDISVAELRIESGDEFSVGTNNGSVNISENANRLVISDEKTINFSSEGMVIIRIPEGKTFEKIELSAGAGEIDIENLNASEVEMHFGAGDVYIDELYVTSSAYIGCAAGEFTVKNGEIMNLEMDLAIGDVELRCNLFGKTEIECGIGDISIELPDSLENYRIEVDKGVSSAVLNGKKIEDEKVYGDGSNRINIDGAVGEISVKTN